MGEEENKKKKERKKTKVTVEKRERKMQYTAKGIFLSQTTKPNGSVSLPIPFSNTPRLFCSPGPNLFWIGHIQVDISPLQGKRLAAICLEHGDPVTQLDVTPLLLVFSPRP